MTNSRQKGKRGERELASYLRGLGYDARRTQQYSGEGESDVVVEGLPLHIECKYGYPRNKFSLGSSLWESAVEQCERDCKDEGWVLCWRESGCRLWKMTWRAAWGLVTVVGDRAVKLGMERVSHSRGKDCNNVDLNTEEARGDPYR